METLFISTEELDLDIDAERVQLPVNAVTGKPYSGGNVATLVMAQIEGGFATSQWLTFKQALELGRCVRKGQKAAARIVKVVPKAKGTDEAPKAQKGRKVTIKTYAVFNLAQTDALPVEKTEQAA